jgi:hypothetical protein
MRAVAHAMVVSVFPLLSHHPPLERWAPTTSTHLSGSTALIGAHGGLSAGAIMCLSQYCPLPRPKIVFKQTPCGRTKTRDRRTPSCRHDILDRPLCASTPHGIHGGIGPYPSPQPGWLHGPPSLHRIPHNGQETRWEAARRARPRVPAGATRVSGDASGLRVLAPRSAWSTPYAGDPSCQHPSAGCQGGHRQGARPGRCGPRARAGAAALSLLAPWTRPGLLAQAAGLRRLRWAKGWVAGTPSDRRRWPPWGNPGGPSRPIHV